MYRQLGFCWQPNTFDTNPSFIYSADQMSTSRREKYCIIHSGYEWVFSGSEWNHLPSGFNTVRYADRLYTGGLTQSQAEHYCRLLKKSAVGEEIGATNPPDDCEYDTWKKTTPDDFMVVSQAEFRDIKAQLAKHKRRK